jgi:hypothetical protein
MSQLAANTMQTLLQDIPPLGVYVPWADQVGEVDWKVVAPDTRYALYPVSAEILASAERASFGQPVGFVVALSSKQLTLADAARLFDATPFEYFSTDAAYRADDTKPAPTIYFAYWGRLRDVPQTVGNYANLETQALSLGVQLAFPIYVNVSAGVTQPAIDFNLALKAQQVSPAAPAPTPIAPMPAAPSAITPTAVTPFMPARVSAAAKPSGIGALLFILAVGGVAAYVGYRVTSRRPTRAAAPAA